MAADTLNRLSCDFKLILESMCHAGITRLCHYVKQKNLPSSIEVVKEVFQDCQKSAELKPASYPNEQLSLIKATKLMARLSTDLRRPLAFPCSVKNSNSVILYN